jgi:hypothetical protein
LRSFGQRDRRRDALPAQLDLAQREPRALAQMHDLGELAGGMLLPGFAKRGAHAIGSSSAPNASRRVGMRQQ